MNVRSWDPCRALSRRLSSRPSPPVKVVIEVGAMSATTSEQRIKWEILPVYEWQDTQQYVEFMQWKEVGGKCLGQNEGLEWTWLSFIAEFKIPQLSKWGKKHWCLVSWFVRTLKGDEIRLSFPIGKERNSDNSPTFRFIMISKTADFGNMINSSPSPFTSIFFLTNYQSPCRTLLWNGQLLFTSYTPVVCVCSLVLDR